MSTLTRSVLRWGLVGALALGGVTLLVGPNAVAAGFAQVRAKATSAMDRFVDDPIALRAQLAKLGEAYPKRIAEVRGELAEVERQLAHLDRDSDIASRVVANSTADLHELRELLAEAEATAATGVPVSIRTRGVRFDIDQARVEARRIADIRLAYQDRLASNAHQARFLDEQHRRLQEVLARLDSEFGDFEVKLAQVDRQIDAIERNERLIEMTQKQKAILADYEKFGKVGNLPQLEARLAQLQGYQEAQLESLSRSGINRDYEREARQQLNDEHRAVDDPFGDAGIEALPPAPRPSARPSHDPSRLRDRASRSVATAEPVVIERR
jgi:chromosome segregation ATPase